MGLLSEGSPLSWEETKKLSDHVRKHGVIQFINLYKRLRDRQGDVLKWGDEVNKVTFEIARINAIYNNSILAMSYRCVISRYFVCFVAFTRFPYIHNIIMIVACAIIVSSFLTYENLFTCDIQYIQKKYVSLK